MRRTDHEQLIERYLSGGMSGAEEEEFFMQVAIDSNLRQTLKAYRIVESALRKHRDAIPAEHTESRLRLMSMLGATASAPELLGSGESIPSSQSHLPGRVAHRRLALGAIAGAFIGIAALLWSIPSGTHDTTRQTPQRLESQSPHPHTTAPTGSVTSPPPAVASPSAPDAGSASTATVQQSTPRTTSPRLLPPVDREPASRRSAPAERVTEYKSASRKPAATTDSTISRQAGTSLPTEPTRPRVSSQDTIRMRMKIVLPDEKK